MSRPRPSGARVARTATEWVCTQYLRHSEKLTRCARPGAEAVLICREMEPGRPFLDSLSIEIRYAFGHTYLDRCGQTMVDIERSGTGWVAGEANPNSGTMENPSLDATMWFDTQRFALSAPRVKSLPSLAGACEALWRVVQANLGLNEIVRFGCRFHWMLPCAALDQAESVLRRLPLNISVPEAIGAKYETTRRSLVAVLRGESGIEYRVALDGIQRLEGLPVSVLMTTEPRLLPKHRRQAQLEFIKRRASYDSNPQYGVHLDVDCVEIAPPKVSPAAFVLAQNDIVREDFLPLLEDR